MNPETAIVTNLAPAGIRRTSSRLDFELGTRQEADPPDFARPVKYWFVDSLPESTRRYSYVGLAMEHNTVLTRPVEQEPDPMRRRFYQDYGLKLMPYMEPIQISRAEALLVNLPWDVSPAGEGDYADWMRAGALAEPMRELAADEAFMPSLFSPATVVRMSGWRALHPPEGSGNTADAIGLILQKLAVMQATLDRIEAK